MKNVIIGIIGVLIVLYTTLMGLDVLTIQSHKNQIEKHLSRVVKNILEDEYKSGDEATVKQVLQEEIEDSISRNAELTVEIKALDLQKGILSVKVTGSIPTITGKQKDIQVEKTAFMEQMVTNQPMYTVTFWVEDEVYKEYQISMGDKCPLPKEPGANFVGWKEYGTEQLSTLTELNQVYQDRTYVAVFEP